MHSTKEIIEEASDLPVEERITVVDSLLRTLNAPDPQIDEAWAEVAMRRLEDLRSGRTQAIPGEEILRELREYFAR